MGNTDSTPFISQLKSMSLAAGGDVEGARSTQVNFLRSFGSYGRRKRSTLPSPARKMKTRSKTADRSKATSRPDDRAPLLHGRGKRSVDADSMEFFDPLLRNFQVGALPPLLESIRVDSKAMASMDPNGLATTLLTVFTILKLMTVRHPRSKPYYEEICTRIYPQQPMLACEERLFQILTKKYQTQNRESQPAIETIFESSLMALRYEMSHMVQQTEVGRNMTATVCLGFRTQEETGTCLEVLPHAMRRLEAGFKRLDRELMRQKRMDHPRAGPSNQILHAADVNNDNLRGRQISGSDAPQVITSDPETRFTPIRLSSKGNLETGTNSRGHINDLENAESAVDTRNDLTILVDKDDYVKQSEVTREMEREEQK